MARKHQDCLDCGKRLSDSQIYAVQNFGGTPLCDSCRANYDTCTTCGKLTHLRDMRQVYCRERRKQYDRNRWAAQRAARGVL
jgi:hypothetical protein